LKYQNDTTLLTALAVIIVIGIVAAGWLLMLML